MYLLEIYFFYQLCLLYNFWIFLQKFFQLNLVELNGVIFSFLAKHFYIFFKQIYLYLLLLEIFIFLISYIHNWTIQNWIFQFNFQSYIFIFSKAFLYFLETGIFLTLRDLTEGFFFFTFKKKNVFETYNII